MVERSVTFLFLRRVFTPTPGSAAKKMALGDGLPTSPRVRRRAFLSLPVALVFIPEG